MSIGEAGKGIVDLRISNNHMAEAEVAILDVVTILVVVDIAEVVEEVILDKHEGIKTIISR